MASTAWYGITMAEPGKARMDDAAKGHAERHRTTFYMDARLATALRIVAARTRRSVNGLIVEAIENLLPAYEERSVNDRSVPPDSEAMVTIRRDLDRLIDRVAVLEAGLRDGKASASIWQDPRPRLTPSEVRREARELILAHGGPLPHKILLEQLEQKYDLPGRNKSENLRTILVHPKSSGFKFIKSRGYVAI